MFYMKKITILILVVGTLSLVSGSLSECVEVLGFQGSENNENIEPCYSDNFKRLARLNTIISRKGPWLSPSEVDNISYSIHLFSNKYSVEAELIIAVMQTESSFRPSAVSCRGAVGLMQIMPSTAKHLAQELKIGNIEHNQICNPLLNVELGTYYIQKLRRQFGDLESTLLAYNYGPTRYASSLEEGGLLVNSYPGKVMEYWRGLR